MPPFVKRLWARWGDMDFNGHMRNTAYLDAAGDVRMIFFADHGFAARDFARLAVGPVILRDELDYFHELHLLDEMDVHLEAEGVSEDGSSWRLRNDFVTPRGRRVARVTSTGAWLDLRSRRLIAPPPELHALMLQVPRVGDFAALASRLRSGAPD